MMSGRRHPAEGDVRSVGKPGSMVCGAPCRRQLWRELLDGLDGEASRLRHLLGLPETDTWSQPSRDPVTPDIGEYQTGLPLAPVMGGQQME